MKSGSTDKDVNFLDNESPSLFKSGVGTAKAKTVDASASRKKSNATLRGKRSSNNRTDSQLVPLDLSTHSKPSRLDIVLPEFLVDHVESLSNGNNNTKEAIENEEKRAQDHKTLEEQIQKALEAVKSLQKSYQNLYQQISQAKNLFPPTDPAHKSLDDILASAVIPGSIADTLTTSN